MKDGDVQAVHLIRPIFETHNGLPIGHLPVAVTDSPDKLVIWPAHSHRVAARLAALYSLSCKVEAGAVLAEHPARIVEKVAAYGRLLTAQAFWLDTQDKNEWPVIRDMLASNVPRPFDGLGELSRMWGGQFDLLRRPTFEEFARWTDLERASVLTAEEGQLSGEAVEGAKYFRAWQLNQTPDHSWRLCAGASPDAEKVILAGRPLGPEWGDLEFVIPEHVGVSLGRSEAS